MTVRDIQKMLGFVPQPNLPRCRVGIAHRNIIHQNPHRLSHPFHPHPNPVDNPHFSHTGETLNTANL